MEFLQYFFQALPYLFSVGMGILPFLLVLWFYKNFAAGLGLFVLIYLLNALFPNLGAFNLGVSLYLMDLAVLVMVPVVLLRLAFLPEARVHCWPLYIFVGVVVLNLFHGLLVFKMQAGVVARPAVYTLVALTYAMSFPANEKNLNTLVRSLLWTVVLLVAIACFRWVAVGFDIRDWLPPSGSFQPSGHSIWRVIISSETLLLAQIAVVGLFFAQHIRPLKGWQVAAPLLFAAVVVLQHRSTWVALLAATGVALALLFVREGGARRSAAILMLVSAMGVVAVMGLAGGKLGQDVGQSFRDGAELKGTAGERLGSWRQMVLKWSGSGPRTLLLGEPFGSSTERYSSDDLGARKIVYQAHNYYVTVLTTLGAVGMLSYLALWAHLLGGLWRASGTGQGGMGAGLLLSLLTAQAAYYLTYGTEYIQGLIMGVALSYLALQKEQGKTSTATPGSAAQPARTQAVRGAARSVGSP